MYQPGDVVTIKRELPLATNLEGKFDEGPHSGAVLKTLNGGYVVMIRGHEFLVSDKEVKRKGASDGKESAKERFKEAL